MNNLAIWSGSTPTPRTGRSHVICSAHSVSPPVMLGGMQVSSAEAEVPLNTASGLPSSQSGFETTGDPSMSSSTVQRARTLAWLAVIRRHPLISFFVLAFGLTWAIMVPLVLGSYGLIPFPEFIP